MDVIQQRPARAAEFNNEFSVADDDNGEWATNAFKRKVFYMIQAIKWGSTNVTINPPENVRSLNAPEMPEDNLKESNSREEMVRNIFRDHAYLAHDLFISRLLNDDDEEESVDAHAENHWKPVREVKEQFVIKTNPLTNPLISSFDVACIVELNPDGSPVDKIQVFSCAVHGEKEQGCTMCQPASKLAFVNARNDVHLRCIDNKVNRVPHVKSSKKKADVTENGENDVKEHIYKLIADLSNKKKKKNPLICEFCSKLFTAVATLKNHYRSHGNIKMFDCSLCESSFTRRFGLKSHMLIHDGKYPFTCSKCSRQFRHRTHFKNHCLNHSSGKPLQCTLCPSNFKNKNTLSRHVKTKHPSTEGQK